jgi:hypothetical protein
VLVNCQLGGRGDEGQPGFTLVLASVHKCLRICDLCKELAFGTQQGTRQIRVIVKRIVDAGAPFRSLAEPWADTATSTGRLMIRGASSTRAKIYCSVLYAMMTRQLVTDWSGR